MSTFPFRVVEHRVPCQHLREYPHATADSQETPFHLAVKQYTPLSTLSPSPGAISIIAAQANAMPKETYEPLWEDLLSRCEKSGLRIRNIWIADMAHQGASAMHNEERLGNDPSWFDHSRDLLHMINYFRDDMPRPIVGIGHSVGAAQLVFLSLIHPRLLTSLILIEPWIAPKVASTGLLLAKASTFRRDLWHSRGEAEEAIWGSPFYKNWDERARERMCQYSLRSTPTLLYPENTDAVTLATPKHQEAFTIYRPNWQGVGVDGNASLEERVSHPDVDAEIEPKAPFYNPWRAQVFRGLPYVRPSVLYIFGSKSMISSPAFRAEKMRVTGTGPGGSGGAKLGQVREVVVPGSHFVPQDNVGRTADEVFKWLEEQMVVFTENERTLDETWKERSVRDKQMMSTEWIEQVKGLDAKQRRGSRASKI